jgi:hypothetical protein
VTQRLVLFAMENWVLFNGWAISQGVRPLRLRIDDFCDLVYYWAARNADEADQAKLDEILGTPPEGQEGDAPGWSREEQLAAFHAF